MDPSFWSHIWTPVTDPTTGKGEDLPLLWCGWGEGCMHVHAYACTCMHMHAYACMCKNMNAHACMCMHVHAHA